MGGERDLEQQEYDRKRTAFLETKGYRVLRFWNADVTKDVAGVLQVIMECLRQV